MEYPPTVNTTNAVWKDLFEGTQSDLLKDIDQIAIEDGLFGLSAVTDTLNFKVMGMIYIQLIAYKVVQTYHLRELYTLEELLVEMEFDTFRELFAAKGVNIQSMLDSIDLSQYY